MVKGNAEEQHQADLDEGSGPDAESAGEEACQQPDDTAAQIKHAAGCGAFVPLYVIFNEMGAEKLKI